MDTTFVNHLCFFGTFFLGPWETRMMDLSGQLGAAAPADAAYRYNMLMHEYFGAFQVALLITTVFISIFKPWKRRRDPQKA